MVSSLPFVSILNGFVESTKTDVATLNNVLKTGLPKDPILINEVVLATLRILSASFMATATILGVSAVNITQLSSFSMSIPLIIGPAITAVIVFHDLYVGASNISGSITVTNTTAQSLLANRKAHPRSGNHMRHRHVRFRNGKRLKDIVNEGPTSLADEITRGMWLKVIWMKGNRMWAPRIGRRYYDVTFQD